jgi:hypothetical protein
LSRDFWYEQGKINTESNTEANIVSILAVFGSFSSLDRLKNLYLLTCCPFFAKILMLNVNDNGNVSGNVSGELPKVRVLLNTSSLSSFGSKVNLMPAPLEARSISKALHQGSSVSLGGVPDAISVNAESKTISYPRWFCAQA